MPNRENEIHLDGNFTKRLVWNEYCEQMVERDSEHLSESSFCQMWSDAMPHVRIRKHKCVDSKCSVCCDICLLRAKSTTKEERLELTKLFKWHRMSFMGERHKYHDRRRLGKVLHFTHVHITTLPLVQTFPVPRVLLYLLSSV